MKPYIKKVLLVDDDEDDYVLFRLALSELEFDIEFKWENSCDHVIHELANWNPDLVFLDINLPRTTGFECLQFIQKAAEYKRIPVVMYSCSELPKDLQHSYELGACLFFRKPSNMFQLTAALRDILQMNWGSPELVKEKFYSDGRCYEYQETK